MTSLATKKCVPCEGGIPKLDPAVAATLGEQIPSWSVGVPMGSSPAKLHRRFTFPNFRAAMHFVSAMAEVAEAAGHHPDFAVHYNRVDVSIWTHAIGGLSENDFVLAYQIDRLPLHPGADAEPSEVGATDRGR
jgi:4a-hydroxytetrahydrobiopterin dehydratase